MNDWLTLLFYYRGKIFGKPSQILSALLLLSKYMLRNVAVIERGRATINNYITHGLKQCKVRISSTALPHGTSFYVLWWGKSSWLLSLIDGKFGVSILIFLCFLSQVISVHSEDLILEAFKKMKDNHSNRLPVVEGTKKQMR